MLLLVFMLSLGLIACFLGKRRVTLPKVFTDRRKGRVAIRPNGCAAIRPNNRETMCPNGCAAMRAYTSSAAVREIACAAARMRSHSYVCPRSCADARVGRRSIAPARLWLRAVAG